jgi:hypothetical protein
MTDDADEAAYLRREQARFIFFKRNRGRPARLSGRPRQRRCPSPLLSMPDREAGVGRRLSAGDRAPRLCGSFIAAQESALRRKSPLLIGPPAMSTVAPVSGVKRTAEVRAFPLSHSSCFPSVARFPSPQDSEGAVLSTSGVTRLMVLWFDAHWPPKPRSNNREFTVAITSGGS